MKETLAAGLEATQIYMVEPQHTAHVPVLSTPAMIGMMEGTCLGLVQQHLEGDELTVGTHVCVSHVGSASVGEEVTIAVRLRDVERRRLTFEVTATGPRGLLSEGTHHRTVIDPSRLKA